MTDAGKKALEELVAGLDGVTPFEERDMMRYEYGGGRLAIIRDGQRNLVADLYHEADREHFLRCSPDRICAIAAYVATLEAEGQKLHGSISAWCEKYDRVNSENATLEARATAAEERVKRLEATIEPFAKEGKRLSGYSQNEWLMVVGDETYLTVGDLVSANTALTGDKP